MSGHIVSGRWLGQACSSIFDNVKESDAQVPALPVYSNASLNDGIRSEKCVVS